MNNLDLFKEKQKLPKNHYSLGKVLEIHKFTWPFVTFFYTILYGNYSYRMTLMNGLFSSYGILWVLKSHTFYDKSFYHNEVHIHTLTYSIVNYLSVSIYYLFPYVTAKNKYEISNIEIYISIVLYSIGMFLHHCSDAQKYYTLEALNRFKTEDKLITNGLYTLIRHPNYSGEFLIWFSLMIVSGFTHPFSYVPVGWLAVATILVGIPTKEKSLKRYDNYKNWEQNTKKLIPFIY